MTVDTVPTVSLLTSLTEALASAATAFPTDEQTALPPTDGISLLDVKNDLLLSYLQNLVFLIILRLRNTQNEHNSEPTTTTLSNEVISKLIELRVYIDRGVRPLEGRLRYQIDKVLHAAEETERIAAQKTQSGKKDTKRRPNGAGADNDSSEASNSASDSEGSDDGAGDDEELEESLHRPNALALAQRLKESTKTQSKSKSSRAEATGAYKPPKITPTAMPHPASDRERTDERSRRRKSNLLNEYIDEELSTAPRAQPSIGSNNTILAQGRSGLSARDRQKERERIEYEEQNFVRLPGESKADRRKARLRGEGGKRDVFGGEDWTGLGGLGDRINRSVQQGKNKAGVFERRDKRKRATEDGQRGDGLGIGETFARRQKVLEDRAERKRRKRG